MSAIFISHSSRDNGVAAEVRERLAAQGHTSVFLDFDPAVGIPAGRDWERELYRRLRACQAVVVLCSAASMASRWCFVEIAHAKAFGKHIFPVKVEPCTVDPALTALQVLDLTADREAAFARLWQGLKVAGLDPANAFDWDGTRPPYPGLLAFEEADAAVYFGREREIHRGLETLNRLRRFGGARALLVLGPSGSGKSSLVRAGILPRLRRNPQEWLIAPPFRPLGRPLHELAGALAAAFAAYGQEAKETQQERGWREILAALEHAAPPLDALGNLARDLRLAAHAPQATLLLVVDQAEELLAAGDERSGKETTAFLDLLRTAMTNEASPVMAVLTLRSDLLGDFQTLPAARGLELEDLRAGALTSADLTQVVSGPARVAEIELEPGLAAVMVADTETEDALPLLAFTLRELVERFGGDGRLTVADYRERLGGLEGSVARAAEGVYAARPLGEEEQRALRTSFLALARLDEDGGFVRQGARLDDLPAAAREPLDRFVAARLLVAREAGGERLLEVAHEALFRSWDRLRGWLEEDRELLLWRKRLAVARREWERTGRDPAALWRGPALTEARAWLEREGERLGADEHRFLAASLAAARRRRRRTAALLAAAGVFLLLIAVAGVALWQRAERLRARAEDQAIVAVAGDWLAADPTRAARVLLELDDPDETAYAATTMSETLQESLAFVELAGHHGTVTSARFNPTGERLVTASSDGTVRLWRLDGRAETVLHAHDRLTDVRFSPAGDRVVAASVDGTAWIWRSDGSGREASPDQPIVLAGHDDAVAAAAFSPDGSRVVTTSDDGTARIWSAAGTGAPTLLAGHAGPVADAAFSPDGLRVVTASDDGTARVWRVAGDGAPVVLTGHGDAVRTAAFSPDGSRVVTASDDGTARVWSSVGDAGAGEPIVLAGHDDAVTAARFSPDGSRVVTASEDGTARVWRADGQGEPLVLTGHDDAVTGAAFSPDGSRVVTVSADETARVWPLADGGEPVVLRGHQGPLRQGWFSPDGRWIVTASEDGTARLWRADGAVKRVLLSDLGNEMVAAAFSGDGRRLLTASQDQTLTLWDLAGTAPPTVLGQLTEELHALGFSSDGRRIVTTSQAGDVQLWEVEPAAGDSGVQIPVPVTDVYAAALSPDGARVALGGRDGSVRVWEAGGGAPRDLGAHADKVEAVAWSADGRRLVTGSQDGTARVWTAAPASGSAPAPIVLGPHQGWVVAAAFSPDGSRVVTKAADRRTRIWNADGSGSPLVFFESGVPAPLVLFDPAGARLATLRGDGTVRVWRADGGGTPLILTVDQEVLALTFSADGERLATVTADGDLREWPLSTPRLWQAVKDATRLCLTPEERQHAFGEAEDEARQRWQECERAYQRLP